MRIFLIAVANIFSFIKQRTFVFFTLFLGLTVCLSALIYFHADTLAYYKERDEINWELVRHTMYFHNADMDAITTFLKQNIINSYNLPQINRLYAHTYVEDGDYILTGYYGKFLDYVIEVGRNFDEASTVKKPVLLGNCLLDADKLTTIDGTQFIIMGYEYNVIGTGSFPVLANVKNAPHIYFERNAIITLEDFKTIAEECSTVDLYFDQILDENQVNHLQNEFHLRFPQEELANPIPSDQQNTGEIYFTLLIVALGTGIILINVIAFFRYWIHCNIKRYCTYVLCGSTGGWVYALIITEMSFISTISFIIGLTNYHLIIPLFEPYGFLYYSLNFNNILMLFVISLALTFLIVHPSAVQVAKIRRVQFNAYN